MHGATIKVLTSSPIIQRKKQAAKCAKNNFKEMIHNPNSISADKNDDSDRCR